MTFIRVGKVAERCADVEAAVRDRDGARLAAAVPKLWKAAESASVAELDAVVTRCVSLLPELGVGAGARFAVLCGALVELGACFEPLIGPVADGLTEALVGAERFRAGWGRVRDDARPPDPEGGSGMDDAVAAMIEAYGAGRAAEDAALAWFAVDKWALPAATLLQRSVDVRAAFRARPELVRSATELAGDRPDLDCLVRLLALLERQQLLVLHRAAGQGWWVTIDGVADNFQLDTLLAGALGGPAEQGLIEGLTVDPAWVSVATDAPEEHFGGVAVGSFDLVGCRGEPISHESTPADIPSVDGVRVVVLDPPSRWRGWRNARRFPLMAGSLVVDAALTPTEAGAWLARLTPVGGRVDGD